MSPSGSHSRRSLVLGGPALAALATLTGGAAPPPEPKFQLTDLGQAFMCLLPAEGEASWLDCCTVDAEWHADYDAGRVAAIDLVKDQTWDAIVGAIAAIHAAARVNPHAHLGDLAAVARYRQVEWNDDNKELDDDDDHEDSSLLLLVRTVLALGGVTENSVNAEELYEAGGRAHMARCGTCQACRDHV